MLAGGRCPKHSAQVRSESDQARGHSRKKYNRRSWRDGTRPAFLRQHPLCADCLQARPPRFIQATDVDHVDGDETNDDWSNLRALCHPCHSRKTASRDGGFGNAPRDPGGASKV